MPLVKMPGEDRGHDKHPMKRGLKTSRRVRPAQMPPAATAESDIAEAESSQQQRRGLPLRRDCSEPLSQISCGKSEFERRAFTRSGRLNPYGAIVEFNNPLHQCQSQPGTVFLVVKPLE